jgi:hypothetical protein
MMDIDIYKMEFNDSAVINRGAICVTRVAGGWIYDIVAYNGFNGGVVFVPFHNEFKQP